MAMVARGETQEEIAAKYDVTDRTVRNWITTAREKRLQYLKTETTEAIVAETLGRHDAYRRELLSLYDEAREAGRTTAATDVMRELRALENDQYIILTKVGFFDGHRWERPQPKDPNAQIAEDLKAMAREFLERMRLPWESDNEPGTGAHHLPPEESDTIPEMTPSENNGGRACHGGQ